MATASLAVDSSCQTEQLQTEQRQTEQRHEKRL
jgi:hypothetical protein